MKKLTKLLTGLAVAAAFLFASTNSLQAASFSDLCVTGNITHATAYKALWEVDPGLRLTYRSNHDILFYVAHNPDGHAVGLPIAAGGYYAPFSGYYLSTLYIDDIFFNVAGTEIIEIIFVKNSNEEIAKTRTTIDLLPTTFSALLRVEENDFITARIRLYAINAATGQLEELTSIKMRVLHPSFWSLHYLSSDSTTCP